MKLLLLTAALAIVGLKAEAHDSGRNVDAQSPDDSPIVTTRHQVTIDGKPLQYTARAGFLSLRDDSREVKARMFYVSYTLTRETERPARPLTFAWNGGPGSPASTLHLGTLGPRRAKTMEEYKTTPRSYELADNLDTWLSFTDLVLVDPEGTGYSYPTKPEYLHDFWSSNVAASRSTPRPSAPFSEQFFRE